ncbi:GyrI-like domain-containing protein [Fulvivirgaceae bacterium BMA10]|uniref:GyrI-like domain-containing protein n=1 Tax=Splendidivirga corallicola TaxID=3051826 RepID=A0ABT8KME5_9BACT|nr:GyrI-like domain-containing protein [Fulvivirgaceae bacterium BMA10]
MSKIDLTRSFPEYYKGSTQPILINLDPLYYLSISDQSSPESEKFTGAIEAIYPMAFGIKRASKEHGRDFVVPKMEAQWWVESDIPFNEVPKEEWHWKILIPMPNFVDIKIYLTAKQKVLEQTGNQRVQDITFEQLDESKVVQAMHIGSYDAEEATIKKLLGFMDQNQLKMNGYHHEIYISDPRRTAADKLKTIIRYPVTSIKVEEV